MPDNAHLHTRLDELLKLRDLCASPLASGLGVQRFLKETLYFARDVMGEDVFRRALRKGIDGDGPLLLANRVAQMAPLIGDNWPDDFAFKAILSELFAVANGDEAKLLKAKRPQGQSRNAHALLEIKLEAHAWYKVLGEYTRSAGSRLDLFCEVYGITADAFQKWRQEARRKLGADYVDRHLVSSVEAKHTSASFEAKPAEWVRHQIEKAGMGYKAELRRMGT